MTTNLHDKMLAAIDAYFSASDGTEAEVAENLLLDVRDEINKQKYVPETNFGNMAEPKIGCVNHDCDKCKAVQEPVKARHTGWGYLDGQVVATYAVPVNAQIAPDLYTTPPAPQPVPVKTYHDGKPWPVAPKPWMGLTETEVEAYDSWADFQVGCGRQTLFDMVRDIEAKLKEKNRG
jgi:hypothetical protein